MPTELALACFLVSVDKNNFLLEHQNAKKISALELLQAEHQLAGIGNVLRSFRNRPRRNNAADREPIEIVSPTVIPETIYAIEASATETSGNEDLTEVAGDPETCRECGRTDETAGDPGGSHSCQCASRTIPQDFDGK